MSFSTKVFFERSAGEAPTYFFVFSLNERKNCTKRYKAYKPKTKKQKNLNIIAISPRTNSRASDRSGLCTNKTEFIFEKPFPNMYVDLSIIKNYCIPGSPDNPTCCEEDFSKDSITKVGPCLNNHVKRSKIVVPMDGELVPAGLTKITLEEQVEACFFKALITQDTVIII